MALKISIGMNLQPGPWGGGNQFGRALADYLRGRGCRVSFDLKDADLDLILLTEPDRRLTISAYDHRDILRYLLFKNSGAVVVHRLNNSSEARDDHAKVFNKFRIFANQAADHTVFVSSWLHQIYVNSGYASPHFSVIHNGADAALWKGPPKEGRPQKFSLVTHHWSNNRNRGFALYETLDRMLAEDAWRGRIDFTYVGRTPEGFKFQNARYVEPLSGPELAREIQSHDIYVTGSRNDSAPMHAIEGALCGLPVLYLQSGGLPEHCQGYGVAYQGPEDFPEKLGRIIEEYEHWAGRMPDYPHTARHMCAQYFDLFNELVDGRDQIVRRRRFGGRLGWVLRTLLRGR